MTHRVFLYGTLCDPELFGIVAGTALDARPGTLSGYSSVWAKGEGFPLIVARPGGQAEGLVADVDDAAKARLDFYELGFHYTLRPVAVTCNGASGQALVYFPDDGIWQEGQPWSLADWQGRYGDLSREAAEEYMRLCGRLSPTEAAKAFPQIRMRASSRLRARANPTPQALDPEMSLSGVRVSGTCQPYTRYFAVREDDLAFPKFGGGLSAVVNRASFMGGDAVSVLPYDPKTDSVLVVRQFRHGVFTRGDANPWTLEPPAGRIDPGESPEQTAMRELREETGIGAAILHKVAEYYPSPSAFSEFITSYVALADLDGQDGRTAGLESEHEDILSHVIGFGRLMELIESGAANSGPLVISAFWLAGHRDRLRRAE